MSETTPNHPEPVDPKLVLRATRISGARTSRYLVARGAHHLVVWEAPSEGGTYVPAEMTGLPRLIENIIKEFTDLEVTPEGADATKVFPYVLHPDGNGGWSVVKIWDEAAEWDVEPGDLPTCEAVALALGIDGWDNGCGGGPTPALAPR